MAKGSNVPYEIRKEVSDAIFERYSSDAQIASVSASFSTDSFPFKGIGYVFFEGSSDHFRCHFEYSYNERSIRTLHIISDWRD